MATEQKNNDEKMKKMEKTLKHAHDIICDLNQEVRSLRQELKKYNNDDNKYDNDLKSFNIDKLLSLLLKGNDLKPGTLIKMEEKDLVLLCRKMQQIFLKEAMLLDLSFSNDTEYIIIGSTSATFNNTLNIFNTHGLPDSNKNINYLFLGNYVDRGLMSLENISLLFSLKLKYPNNIYLLRGNHECRIITRLYGFYDELKKLNMINLYNEFIDVFECMPCAALIDYKIFAVNGGISPYLTHFSDIRNIQRPCDVPRKGLLTDLLWSDPVENDFNDYKDSVRGAGCNFGPKQVAEFCDKFKIELIVRGIELQQNGYDYSKKFDQKVISLFSIKNYCGVYDNKGAIMKINKQMKPTFIELSSAWVNNTINLENESKENEQYEIIFPKNISTQNYVQFDDLNESIIIEGIDKSEKRIVLSKPKLLGKECLPYKLSFCIEFLEKTTDGYHGGVHWGSDDINNDRISGHKTLENGAKTSVIDCYLGKVSFRVYGVSGRGPGQHINAKGSFKELNGKKWEIIFNKNNTCTFLHNNIKILENFVPVGVDGYIGFWIWNSGKMKITNITVENLNE